jgi:hypothetical protein
MVEELKDLGQLTSSLRMAGGAHIYETTNSWTRRMLRKARLLTAALGFGCNLVIAGGLPASAEPRVVAEGDGITVYENAIKRADGGTGMLLIARLDPRRMTISVVEGNEAPPAAVPWSVTVNGSYFNEAGTPVERVPTASSGVGMGGVRSSIRAILPLTSPMIWQCNPPPSSGKRQADKRGSRQ